MASESINIGAATISEEDNSFKKIRYFSQECVAYVEIRMVATAIDEKLVEYNYDQQDITKAAVFLPLSQGEIKLRSWQCTLSMDFDFIKTLCGYQLTFKWATFGDDNGYKLYYVKKGITVSIPMGSSSFKNMKIEYSLYPRPHAKEKISVTIVHANLHILNASPNEVKFYIIKDLPLKKQLNEIFNNQNTINIDLMVEQPKLRPLEKEKTLRI